MESNQIYELKENTFNELNNLRVLNLSENRISNWKEKTFNGLSNLEVLNLRENKIIELKLSKIITASKSDKAWVQSYKTHFHIIGSSLG